MVENSDDHCELDISRARELVGWRPRHSLAGTLPEMIKRLKADPTAWYAKNKLEPSVVAASEPELEEAAERLRGPLERSVAEVDAAIKRHRRPGDRAHPSGARARDPAARNPQCLARYQRVRLRPADPGIRFRRDVSTPALGSVAHGGNRGLGDVGPAGLLDHQRSRIFD